MDTEALLRLTNLTKLNDIDTENTRFLKVDHHERFNDVIVFHFLGPKVDKNSTVWKAHSFPKWEHEQGQHIMKRYIGPKFAMFNLTNNCSKFVNDPIEEAVIDTCLEPNDGTKTIVTQAWRRMDLTPAFYRRPVIIRANQHNYIYCMFNSITIDNETEGCPETPFRLPFNVTFETSGVASTFEMVNVVTRDLGPDAETT